MPNSNPVAGSVEEPVQINRFLRVFFGLRWLMVLASLGSIAGSFLMYWVGARFLLEAGGFIKPEIHEGAHLPAVLVLEAVDAFLVAMVLTIFSYGITIGFVLRLKPAVLDTLPEWMKVSGIGELKHTLSEVVLVVLIVTFTKEVLEAEKALDWSYLILPVAVLLLAAALWLLKAAKH